MFLERRHPSKHLALAALLLFFCSPVRHVRPIEKGELVATAGLGGPFVGQTGWMPLPLLSLGADYGVADRVDIEAGSEATAALFGVLQIEGACNWRPLRPAQRRPGLNLGARMLGATNFRAGASRLWPSVGATALWQLNHRMYCYAGVDNWFETHSTRYDGNEQKYHWLPVVHAGVDFGGKRWQTQAEAVWYVPNIYAGSHTAQTLGIGNQGCLGVFFGVSRSFGKIK